MGKHDQPKRIILLGSTGSIGRQTLEIVRALPGRFKVVALACGRGRELLEKQIAEFKPAAVALAEADAVPPANAPKGFFRGTEGICRMIRETEADIVVNGISGAAGFLPSLAALEDGQDLALANKETMVMAGELALRKAAQSGSRIIPVDSEHAAVFSLLQSLPAENVSEIVLTASGGPFRERPLDSLARVTVEEALRHPTWRMGPKITIDSATMANKALEVMEATHFFRLPVSKIKVVIHPQSIVHSLVRTIDGALYAQLNKPDMRLPIQNALTYPELVSSDFAALDLPGIRLDFLPVEPERYPLLALGRRAAEWGRAYPAVFNAANEIAVEEFLAGRIGYPGIERVVAETLAADWPNLNETEDDVIFNDKSAREKARSNAAKVR